MKPIGSLASEFALIQQAFRDGAPVQHPLTCLANGDDASVHRLDEKMELVVSTDSSLATVHWPETLPLDQAAKRAVCSALSDLAAMGAEPLWVWVAVMADSRDAVLKIGQGVNRALHRFGIELAGGDTVSSPCNGLTVTVAGQLPHGSAMRRDSALADDHIWLVGSVGEAALGLQQLLADDTKGSFVRAWAEVTPQLEAGVAIRQSGIRCCIDVSDGLAQDASHIAKASGIGMQIDLERMQGWRIRCQQIGEARAIQAAIAGGEDYALLFTAPAHIKGLESWATSVGRCNRSNKVEITVGTRKVAPVHVGFNHFSEEVLADECQKTIPK